MTTEDLLIFHMIFEHRAMTQLTDALCGRIDTTTTTAADLEAALSAVPTDEELRQVAKVVDLIEPMNLAQRLAALRCPKDS